MNITKAQAAAGLNQEATLTVHFEIGVCGDALRQLRLDGAISEFTLFPAEDLAVLTS